MGIEKIIIQGKQPSQIDVPVQLNVWIRTRCQRAQFDVIKKAKPSLLFIQSDGGRNSKEWKLINQNRKIFEEEIDWNCTIYKLYESENRGMLEELKTTLQFVFTIVDRCIFLEDDIVPSVSFFRFCKEMLDKYECDERIGYISGLNIMGIYDQPNADYFFSRRGSVWGYAMWKRSYERFNDWDYVTDPYVMRRLRFTAREYPIIRRQIESMGRHMEENESIMDVEYGLCMLMYGHHQLALIPQKNLISNIGFGEDATHAHALEVIPRRIRRVFNMKTYELDFPLKEARYVIPDEAYLRQCMKLHADGHPALRLFMNLERVFLHIRAGNFVPWVKSRIRKN